MDSNSRKWHSRGSSTSRFWPGKSDLLSTEGKNTAIKAVQVRTISLDTAPPVALVPISGWVMTPEEFAAVYPAVIGWIQQTLAEHENSAKTVASKGFKRLPLYFAGELLESTKVVTVDRVPIPPVSRMGLRRFKEFEGGDYDGITYLNTFFVKHTGAGNEELYFHELIHVIQWRLLGPERFLKLYADGLERFGYQNSPLEKMAYTAQNKFSHSKQVFDGQTFVLHELRKLSAL